MSFTTLCMAVTSTFTRPPSAPPITASCFAPVTFSSTALSLSLLPEKLANNITIHFSIDRSQQGVIYCLHQVRCALNLLCCFAHSDVIRLEIMYSNFKMTDRLIYCALDVHNLLSSSRALQWCLLVSDSITLYVSSSTLNVLFFHLVRSMVPTFSALLFNIIEILCASVHFFPCSSNLAFTLLWSHSPPESTFHRQHATRIMALKHELAPCNDSFARAMIPLTSAIALSTFSTSFLLLPVDFSDARNFLYSSIVAFAVTRKSCTCCLIFDTFRITASALNTGLFATCSQPQSTSFVAHSCGAVGGPLRVHL
ncbi:hypothetical protein, conserved in T.vivax [Trypanosoma vivax Y486]|uniref:Uncharacterized protein n=1 Tax=Trypanosoma vivax (strain Y486) TaxID=1055687 RepID=F9WSV5_TRYVY|nr:hypothetical protein, conserved in T.vivax [Trypanosoma vivax Y486]|eukprot:CCD20644.1 hypothetical protein, conserved in T.vivax [Trypanosoma vivax Y486]